MCEQQSEQHVASSSAAAATISAACATVVPPPAPRVLIMRQCVSGGSAGASGGHQLAVHSRLPVDVAAGAAAPGVIAASGSGGSRRSTRGLLSPHTPLPLAVSGTLAQQHVRSSQPTRGTHLSQLPLPPAHEPASLVGSCNAYAWLKAAPAPPRRDFALPESLLLPGAVTHGDVGGKGGAASTSASAVASMCPPQQHALAKAVELAGSSKAVAGEAAAAAPPATLPSTPFMQQTLLPPQLQPSVHHQRLLLGPGKHSRGPGAGPSRLASPPPAPLQHQALLKVLHAAAATSAENGNNQAVQSDDAAAMGEDSGQNCSSDSNSSGEMWHAGRWRGRVVSSCGGDGDAVSSMRRDAGHHTATKKRARSQSTGAAAPDTGALPVVAVAKRTRSRAAAATVSPPAPVQSPPPERGSRAGVGGRPVGSGNKGRMVPRKANASGQVEFGCRSAAFTGVYRSTRREGQWRAQFSYAGRVCTAAPAPATE